MTRCVFLDRDGVLNKDNPNYTYTLEAFEILPGVMEGLRLLKNSGYRLVVVTNQSGIDKGLYTIDDMKMCHDHFQRECGGIIDHFYFSPYHRSVTASLFTKPESLLFEKAIAKFGIDTTKSWMVGDRSRDLIPAKKLGIKTIQIGDEFEPEHLGEFKVDSLLDAARLIINNS